MDFTHILSWIVVCSSAAYLGWLTLRFIRFDNKEVKGFQITNKKTGKQTTISAHPDKADVKRLLETLEH